MRLRITGVDGVSNITILIINGTIQVIVVEIVSVTITAAITTAIANTTAIMPHHDRGSCF